MTLLLLDTSAVIGLIERNSASVRSVVAAATQPVGVSVITIGALEHGIAATTDTGIATRRRASLRAIIQTATIEDVGPSDAAVYGPLSHELRELGFGPRIVGVADRWISATAIRLGATLVTEDARLAEALAATSFERSDLVELCT